MQMVLSSILTNASEATDGKGHIHIACAAVDVDQEMADRKALKPGPYIKLSVRDNGQGMDNETRNRMFEPFFTTKFQGRGLGLAAAYGVVRSHDGIISVTSEPGEGTLVEVYLPVNEEQE
jgi:signal transduction histidine kinase